jgi:hypothetical protein
MRNIGMVGGRMLGERRSWATNFLEYANTLRSFRQIEHAYGALSVAQILGQRNSMKWVHTKEIYATSHVAVRINVDRGNPP